MRIQECFAVYLYFGLVLFVHSTQVRANGQPAPGLSDPVGVTFGSGAIRHDIVALETTRDAERITFNIHLADPVVAPSSFLANSIVGFIDLDVDRNAGTGTRSQAATYIPIDTNDIGAEYFVDLFSEQFSPGRPELIDTATMLPVGLVDLDASDRRLTVHVPLDMIGGSSELDYVVIVGTFNEFNDVVFGSTVPEPSSLSIVFPIVAFLAVLRMTRSRLK